MNPILVLTARKAVVFSVLRLCSAGILPASFFCAAHPQQPNPPSEILDTWEGESK